MLISQGDWKEYRKNAVSILRKNSQYATAEAVRVAVNKQICKKPLLGEFVYHCACCGNTLNLNKRFCDYCGQATNWNDEVEE